MNTQRTSLLSCRILLFLTLLIFTLAPVNHVQAQARELITQGEFAAAYDEAVAQEDVPSQLLAARAANLQAYYQESEQERRELWLKRAIEAAEQAMLLEPERAQAYFELARAKGVLATYRGVLQNLNTAPRLEELFLKTLELDPEHADALIALAQWHLELSERGVAWLYGADRQRVVPLFQQALALEPRQINLRVEYATALKRLDDKEAALEQLERALSLPANTAVDKFERARARQLLRGWQPEQATNP